MSTSRRPRAGTSARVRSAGSSCGSEALPGGVAVPLVIASVVVFVGGILVEEKLELQTDPIEWVNQDSQVIHDLNTLDRETGSSSELGMFVQSKRRVRRPDRRVRGQLHDQAARRAPATRCSPARAS